MKKRVWTDFLVLGAVIFLIAVLVLATIQLNQIG